MHCAVLTNIYERDFLSPFHSHNFLMEIQTGMVLSVIVQAILKIYIAFSKRTEVKIIKPIKL